jgi:hypothetical protein
MDASSGCFYIAHEWCETRDGSYCRARPTAALSKALLSTLKVHACRLGTFCFGKCVRINAMYTFGTEQNSVGRGARLIPNH